MNTPSATAAREPRPGRRHARDAAATPGPDSPGRARQWLADLCVRWACDELSFDCRLLVSELTTTALLHTDGAVLTVSATFEQSMLTIALTDDFPCDLWIDPLPLAA